MIADDLFWNEVHPIKVKNGYRTCHIISKCSSLEPIGFDGYVLVRPCNSDMLVEIPLDNQVKEACECRCPAFGSYESEL